MSRFIAAEESLTAARFEITRSTCGTRVAARRAMPRSRLYRSIVVFGTSLGTGLLATGIAVTAGSGCTASTSHPDSGHIIDAGSTCGDAVCPDGWHAIIDASIIDGNWTAIADAPWPIDGNRGSNDGGSQP